MSHSSSPTTDLRDRARGAMLGLACGDALGAQVEFMARGSFPTQSEMTGGGPHRLAPGEWTDDTAMALALADSLARNPGPDLERADVVARWIAWMDTGDYSCTGECFDIGNRTRLALEAHRSGGQRAVDRLSGYAEGNGALMRVTPVAIRHVGDPHRAAHVAAAQSRLTHGAISADVCSVFTTMMTAAIGGEMNHAQFCALRPVREVARMNLRDVSSAGRALDTYRAALWAVAGADSAAEAIIRAVNLGDDADTVGAVTGAIAGALWGARSLPLQWLRVLAWRTRLVTTADALLMIAAGEAST